MPTEVLDFVEGQRFRYTQLVDDKLVLGFADLTGDHNPIHVDDAFARKTRFGQRIAHGGILFGMISKVLATDMPGVGTVYLCQSMNFRAPVFIGDMVTLEATISEILPKGVARVDVVIKKQTGDIVMDGVAEVKLPGWVTNI